MNWCDSVKLSSIIDSITLQKNVVIAVHVRCTMYVITDHFIVYHYPDLSEDMKHVERYELELPSVCLAGCLRI